MIRFLHIADAHLGSPFKGVGQVSEQLAKQLVDATYTSFRRLVTRAIKEQVDMVLLVGDTYHSTKPSVSTQIFLRQEMQRLYDANIPVVMCHGNHDFLSEQHHYLALPQNVYVLDTTVETVEMTLKSGEQVAISGFSYGARHITESRIADYPQRFSDVDYHIGMLHGYTSQARAANEHAYAPFTLAQLNEKNYNYWALGHIHRSQALQMAPPVLYAGSIQGLNRHETGIKGGFLVAIDKNQGVKHQLIDTAPVQWREVDLSLTDVTDLAGVLALLEAQYAIHVHADRLSLLTIVWQDYGHLPEHLLDQLTDMSLCEGLNQQSEYMSVIRLKLAPLDESQLLGNSQMSQALVALAETPRYATLFHEALQPLYQSKEIKQLFADLAYDEDFQEDVVQLTNQLIRFAPETPTDAQETKGGERTDEA